MRRRAFITGITGQDGSYLAELLLEKGYEVYGLVRRTSGNTLGRLRQIESQVRLLTGDLTDEGSVLRALTLSRPMEVYHLASQSFIEASVEMPIYTMEVTGIGAVRVFEAARQACPSARVYHASSSEMFGCSDSPRQRETTPVNPQSPYACAKAMAHHAASVYRRAYGQFIACGINFNHESERRGEEFVTRKITRAVARIALGEQLTLCLGNLRAERDWTYAPEVMEAAWQMLQLPTPDDYVIASGESHTVQEFADAAFETVGLHASDYIAQDATRRRALDVPRLCGDASKAQAAFGWHPTVDFAGLAQRMVRHDVQQMKAEASLVDA